MHLIRLNNKDSFQDSQDEVIVDLAKTINEIINISFYKDLVHMSSFYKDLRQNITLNMNQ